MKYLINRVIRKLLFYFIAVIRRLFYKILSADLILSGKPNRLQPLLLEGNGKVVFGDNVTIGYYPSPFYFSGYAYFDLRGTNSLIDIGNNVYFNNNTTLIADGARIVIGDKSLIGINFSVYTSDFHTLEPTKRNERDFPREDVTIGKNVFIGSNVTILKGVSIGDNSVIGAGSIVSSNIPKNVLATGIPCRVLKQFEV